MKSLLSYNCKILSYRIYSEFAINNSATEKHYVFYCLWHYCDMTCCAFRLHFSREACRCQNHTRGTSLL